MSSAAPPVDSGVARPKVSLCMIVKNEEHNLAECLRACANLVDEIVIVDTGSTDRTKEIATGFGARLFELPWPDSFSAARNESLRHATGRWIFWMDADDRLDEENRVKLQQLFAGLTEEMAGYLMICRVLPSEAGQPARIVDHTRLFPNHPQVRWSYRVHEQILPAVLLAGGKAKRADVVICHVGYQGTGQSQAKLQRNLRLMEMDFKDNPNDAFVNYNLGRAHERLGKLADALPYWRRSLANAAPQETYVAKLYYLLAQGHYQLGQRQEAATMCLAGLARFPTDVELLLVASTLLSDAGDLPAAEACLLRLLDMPRQGMALGDDPGLRTFKARCHLARIYRDQKRLAESEVQWRKALEEQPDFAQAWLGLGQVYLDQCRWDELEDAIEKLETSPAGAVEAAVLRGLRLANNKEFKAARRLMEDTVAKFPKAIEPHVLLCRLLLRDGRDPAAAERWVRALLAVDPANAEGRRYLARLTAPAAAQPSSG